jgi:hypothetical protein
MNIKCGSCGVVQDALTPECPNCGFPNRTLEEPVHSPIEIDVDIAVARSMEEYARNRQWTVSRMWQEAAEWYLTNLHVQSKKRLK